MKFTAGNPNAAGPGLLVEPGVYMCEVLDAKEKTSKSSGNPMIELKCGILLEDGSEGPKFFEHLVCTPSVMWKIDAFLNACGCHPGEGKEVELEEDEMIGWQFRARLKVDKSGQSPRMAVDAFLSGKDADDDDIPF